MYNSNIITDKALKTIGLELMFWNPQKYGSSEGITTVELSKRLNLKSDIVKKKLKILLDKDLVRVTGVNPKIWKFDDYSWERMDTEDPVYQLLCNFEDVDFDQYFEY